MDIKIKTSLIYLNIILSIIIEIVISVQNPGYKISPILVMEAVIWPILLIALNMTLLIAHIENSVLKCSLFMILGFLLGNLFGYLLWVGKTGYLLSPDYETRGFILIKLGYYFLVTSLFFVCLTILSWLKNPSRY